MDVSYDTRWSSPLSIRHDAIMGIQVLAFDGELNAAVAADAEESVQVALEHAAPLVLDLRMLRAVDATGASVLRSVLRWVKSAGIPAALVRPVERQVASLLATVGPEGDVRVELGVSEAINAVAPARQPDAPRWTPEPAVRVPSRRRPASS